MVRPAVHRRTRRARRLVLLIDVSGSMAPYSDALLRFAHVLTCSGPTTVETFTLGTRLTRLTRALRHRDPEVALRAAAAAVPDYAGGTRLGETLKVFTDWWRQRGLARGAVVIVFADGWERGGAELLGVQAARLSRLVRAVIWSNPHVGRAGYAPVQSGIVAALPHLHQLMSGHSVVALEDLLEVGLHMRDVLDDAERWWRAGEPITLATVVGTWKSSPRQAGASMLLGGDGAVVGSVSGGCVEGAVYELARQVVADGVPQLQRYGVSDDDAFSVGLTCGGIIDVYIERIDPQSYPELGAVAEAIRSGTPVAVATTTRHPDPARVGQRRVLFTDSASGTLGSVRSDAAVTDDGRGLLAAGRNGTLEYGPDGERLGDGMEVFVASYAPPARMLVFGAIDFAAAAARVGAFLGYHVTVCDARAVFATPQRFPDADEVVVEWPHRYLSAERDAGRLDERTVLAVLTHDPKFDVPLLVVALGDEWTVRPAYVGAMGSRRTHDDREARLRERGLTDEQLARLHSPIGLNIGARTPEETAVSIAAEIIAGRWGGDGQRLTRAEGSIHHN